MLKRAARLLFPALRWQTETGFGHEAAAIDHALSIGVGGLIIFGGNARAVRELTESLHQRSAHPLLIAADLDGTFSSWLPLRADPDADCVAPIVVE